MYYRKDNDFEYICYQNATLSYPVHTHARHITIGYVLDGEIRLTSNGETCTYHTGDYFCIMPDTPHAVDAVTAYSMISVCVSDDKLRCVSEREMTCSMRLKHIILDAPENVILIEDMAHKIGISPYHMIRTFKTACGLTPHQFQIQCRIRKAQKLLEEGKSVTEVAYATGFCDQSHFDRCFHKIVGLTPNEYKQSVKRLA